MDRDQTHRPSFRQSRSGILSYETVASAPSAARLHDAAHTNVTAVDPRTKIVVLVLINFLVLGSGPFAITLAAAGIVAMLYLSVANWRGAMKFTVFVGVCSTAFLVLPGILGGPIGAAFAVTGYWLARFGVSCGYAAYFISTTGPAPDFRSARRHAFSPRSWWCRWSWS
jgi:hypothetical protein